MFTPIKKNILVKLQDRVAETKNGVIIPEISRGAEEWGEVVAVANDCTDLSAGDTVLVLKTQGTHFILDGVDMVVLPEQKVLAIRTR